MARGPDRKPAADQGDGDGSKARTRRQPRRRSGSRRIESRNGQRIPARCFAAWRTRQRDQRGVSHSKDGVGQTAGAGPSEWIVFQVTDVSVPPVDLASDDMKKLKETLRRGLTDEQIGQYVAKLETDIGTTINQAAFAQVTGANN